MFACRPSHPFSHRPLRPLLRGLVASLALVAAAAEDAKPTLVPVELFTVPEGLEVTVWATSPRLSNPTNIDVDREGRIWVCEGVNYRGKFGRRKEGDRIMVLTDTDGDGKADKEHVFVQEEFLVAPLGISVIDNKVIVSMTPDMIVYTDVNRNQVFDQGDTREVLLTGFNGRNHDHSLHSVTVGPDGLWYFNHGNCGSVFTDKSGKTFRVGSPYNPQEMPGGGKAPFKSSDVGGEKSDDGHVYLGGATYRMNADGTNVQVIGHNYRNSYEQTVTSFGDVFQNDNDDPPACRVANVLEYGNAGFASRDGKRAWNADRRPGQTTPVAEWRQDDPGTMPAGDVYGGGSPTGIVHYENGALGAKWAGLLLSCEPGRNVVFGYQPKPNGAGFQLDRTDWLTTNAKHEFTGSDFTGGKWDGQLSTQFRPSDVAVGADGAIYVADWFDGRVGGHATFDDGMTGTIYRIAPKGFKPSNPKFDEKTIDGLITALKSPAVNVRGMGFAGLKAQGEKAIPAVAALLSDADQYIAARAIWLIAQLGPAGVAKVQPLLKDKDDSKRLIAYRALRRANIEPVKMAAAMVGDASAGIRREVALTLRDVPAADSVATLVQVAKAFDGKDRAYLDALGIGSFGKEKEVYAALAKDAGAPEAWSDGMGWIAWRLGAVESVAALKTRALSAKISNQQRKLAMDGLAFIQDKSAATAMVELAGVKEFPHQSLATWWCINRLNNEWKDFGVREVLKERGVYDPDKVVITPITMPEPPPGPSKLPPAAEIAKMTGDAANGQIKVAVCYTCHHIGGQGMEFGPDLTMFGKTQGKEVVIDAILNPSKDISHGFDGSRVVLTDGATIDGIVLANGDPLIIKSMGGLTQTIPKSKVKEVKKLGRSLMFPAEMLGLDAQGLADIAAYLASDKLK